MTTTDIVKHETSTEEKKDWSEAMSDSSLLPKAYQKQPANLFLAAEYADELGIGRMNALTGIHIIDGRPTLSSSLMAALVRRAGHTLRVETSQDQSSVRATLVRSDDPDFTFTAIWNMQRAENAGLTNKDVWKKYPAAMMKARAISEVIRDGASEVLAGILYIPEELNGDTLEAPEEPKPVKIQRRPRKHTAKKPTPDDVQADPTTGEILDAEPVEDGAA